VLWQDRIFDRSEKGRVDSHRKQRKHHQRDGDEMHRKTEPRQDQPAAADEHDQDFAEFDDADDPCLVARVGQLPRQRRQEKERQDEDAGGDRAEQRFLFLAVEHAINDEQHHRILEQIVVECTEKLGDEKGQEPALPQQRNGAGHGGPIFSTMSVRTHFAGNRLSPGGLIG
jgi:hypothetical protein